MDKDLILYILYFIPVSWVIIFDQQNLKDRKVFFKHLFISIILMTFGAVPELYEHKEHKSLSYFGAQMLFIFLMLYTLIQKVYVRLYNKDFKVTELTSNFREKIANGILYFGMISFPFLIDEYIIKKLF